jgi:hypothetical protein
MEHRSCIGLIREKNVGVGKGGRISNMGPLSVVLISFPFTLQERLCIMDIRYLDIVFVIT